MHLFVTGATGVLGRPVVRGLIRAGHTVRALVRPGASPERVLALGAHPAPADLGRRESLAAALAGCDAALHLATRIPPGRDVGRSGAWSENDFIRREGTRHLVDAALDAGVGALVYPGVCFLYPDSADRWLDAAATAPADPLPGLLASSMAAEGKIARFTAAGGRGVVLRMGYFYGPQAGSTQELLAAARRGLATVVGPGGAYLPTIWVEDAAAAVVAAAERAPAGVYDAVDDEPLPRAVVRRLIARAAGRRRLVAPPLWLLRLAGGRDVGFLGWSQRVSNRRLRQATGWAPAVPSAREGWVRLGRGGLASRGE